jgi:hypothetical protein
MQPANFLFYRVFTKENATSFLRKSSSPFSLQEFRPLTPLKETDRFTSLMVIGMTETMCNRDYKEILESSKITGKSPSLHNPLMRRKINLYKILR